jgi:hypothetical protein
MTSYLSRLSPVPAFADYSGPYKVGTVDVEIPVSELNSPSPTPDVAANIHTVQFRIFYPAAQDSKGKRISWLPAPQRLHVAAYTQFLGLGPMVASVLSYVSSRPLYEKDNANCDVCGNADSSLVICTTRPFLRSRTPPSRPQTRRTVDGLP